MTRIALSLIALLTAIGVPATRAETVYQPGHRTWTNSYVPPHYETRPDTRYVAPHNQPLESLVDPSSQKPDPRTPPPKNQPLESLIEPQKKPPSSPPVSVYSPAPQYDPYYNALNAASRGTWAQPKPIAPK
jgi:hypothetical protein